jgi:ribonuclease P/MRP protein subunit POP1
MIGPALLLWKVNEDGSRQAMIRIHPSITTQVWEQLHLCAKDVTDVTIEDARFEIGAIDIFGPMANEVLSAVLKVGDGACAKIWNQLRGIHGPKCLPMGAVIDLNLRDPRIEYFLGYSHLNNSFPPRKIKPSEISQLPSILRQWPNHVPDSVNIFNSVARNEATAYLSTHTRGSLQKARNELLSKGNPPNLPPSPSIIPSLLLRRDIGSWTLLLPWSWIAEFWYSLMHYPQSRFGGLMELAQIGFEAGGRGFPEDYPGTSAGEEELGKRSGLVKQKWGRRPDGKRESWRKVFREGERNEIGDPFKCSWGMLFDDKQVVEEMDTMEIIKRQAEKAMEEDHADHFLLSPKYAKQVLEKKMMLVDFISCANSDSITFSTKRQRQLPSKNLSSPHPPDQRQKWTNLLGDDSTNGYPTCPGEEDLLGFVTTGNVSLLEGRGRAVGALSFTRAEIEEERWREEKQFSRWCIVRDVGKEIGRLAKWEVND